MKICFVVSSLQGGGAERVISLLANGFSKRGHRVKIICLNYQPIFYEIEKEVEVDFISHPQVSKNILEGIIQNFKKIIKLAKFFKKDNPDVIISFITKVNLLAIIANFFSRRPLIISERANPDKDAIRAILKALRMVFYRFADALVIQTDFAKKYFKNFNVPLIKIHNPVKMFSNQYSFEKRDSVVLGVGRLSIEKGFDYLIEAFAKAKVPSWSLWLVGDGCERKNLEKKTLELNQDQRVIFWGRQKNMDWFYRKAGVFVLPSRHEGFPNALCEAMAAGIPSLAFDCEAGPCEIIENGRNGILVEQGRVDLLADAIKKIVTDESLRKKLGLSASEITNHLNLESVISRWEILLNKILRGS